MLRLCSRRAFNLSPLLGRVAASSAPRLRLHLTALARVTNPKPVTNNKPILWQRRCFSNAISSDASTTASQSAASGQFEGASGDSQSSDTTLREEILSRALDFVPELGWDMAAINKAVAEKDLSVASSGMFERGAVELVDFLVHRHTQNLGQKLKTMPLHVLNTKERIKAALKLRLEMNIPHMARWHEALALGAMPQNLPYTLQNIATMIDDIWHLVGDKSTDMNWYSKRALLGSVYVASELYMTTDKSESFEDTWKFVERRLDDVVLVGRLPAEVQSLVTSAGKFAYTIFEEAMNASRRPRRS